MADNTPIIDPQEAYSLPTIGLVDNSKAFIMVDRNSNEGFLLNYNTLADAILSKLVSTERSVTDLKVYFINDEDDLVEEIIDEDEWQNEDPLVEDDSVLEEG